MAVPQGYLLMSEKHKRRRIDTQHENVLYEILFYIKKEHLDEIF